MQINKLICIIHKLVKGIHEKQFEKCDKNITINYFSYSMKWRKDAIFEMKNEDPEGGNEMGMNGLRGEWKNLGDFLR